MTLEVVNLSNVSCDEYYDEANPTFCYNLNTWQLCSDTISVIFKSQTPSGFEKEEKEQKISQLLTFLSLMHGTLLPILAYKAPSGPKFGTAGSEFQLNIKMDNLSCNPSFSSTICTLTQIMSWVSITSIITAVAACL